MAMTARTLAMLSIWGACRGFWRAGLCAAGFECVPHVKGAGEHAALAEIWLDHLREAVERVLD